MMKDIYSPLEIDEQWDQRAEMQEGDATAAPTTSEAGAMTATMEPAVESNDVKGVPAPDHAEPGSVEPATEDTPHIALHAEDNQMAPEADAALGGMSDDEAVAKLAGDDKTEDATTDPSDSAMESGSTLNPQSGDTVIPTTKIEPTEPRVQPEEKSNTSMTENHDGAIATDVPDTTSNEHFVLGGQPEPNTETPAHPDTEEEEAPPISPTETEESTEEGIDSAIDAAMSKIKEAEEMLKAEKEKIAARIQEHEQAETEARTKKESDQEELRRIEDELGKLDKLQPAA
ncbi:MAG: hypothetical protein U0516_00075 [Candidatus Saccharibacteria bacterium]